MTKTVLSGVGARLVDKRGTCPACLGVFQLADIVGKTVVGKHGWQEDGGRQVGVYDVVTHVGQCFGVGYEPFELSPKGSWEFMSQVLYPRCLGHLSYLARLASGCSLMVDHKESDGRITLVKLTPTNEAGTKKFYTYRVRGEFVTAYDRERNRQVAKVSAFLRQDFESGSTLCAMALAWTLQPVMDGASPPPTVHFKNEGARMVYCGSRSHYLKSTAVQADTTCGRCLKALAVAAAEQVAREAVGNDADELVKLLKEQGPKTVGQMKKALGWDTKRVNKALAKADGDWRDPSTRRVDHHYNGDKPDTYSAKG